MTMSGTRYLRTDIYHFKDMCDTPRGVILDIRRDTRRATLKRLRLQ